MASEITWYRIQSSCGPQAQLDLRSVSEGLVQVTLQALDCESLYHHSVIHLWIH